MLAGMFYPSNTDPYTTDLTNKKNPNIFCRTHIRKVKRYEHTLLLKKYFSTESNSLFKFFLILFELHGDAFTITNCRLRKVQFIFPVECNDLLTNFTRFMYIKTIKAGMNHKIKSNFFIEHITC